MHKRRLHSVG